jgi:spermidine synthase
MTAPQAALPDRTRRLVLLAVGGLGATAIMAQLALLRELVSAFSGNELVFGVALGSWLLLTGIGAWLGRLATARLPPEPVIVAGLAAAAVLPLAQVAAVRVLRDVVFTRGAAVGVPETVLGCTAVLLPFCLLAGGLFPVACALLARNAGSASLGRVYVAETLGGIAGGAAFSFFLVPQFDHLALLVAPAVGNLIVAAALAWHFGRRLLLTAVAVVAAGLAVHAVLIDADEVTTALQHWPREPVWRSNSPYGRLVVTRDAGQLTFFENGVPVLATPNVEQVEETVHYAMSQRPDAREVLLIAGGIGGSAREILRYGAARVTYVELDPQIVAAGRRFLPENLAEPRIEVVAGDGRRYVAQTARRFDVVIVAVPDPSTAQLNRFYTAEFFATTARVLRPGGVLALGVGRYENYVSPKLGRLLAATHATLRLAFAHVRLVPGGRVYFLASNGPLTLDIAARLEALGLATKLVNRHYLEAMLTPDRLADLDRAVAHAAEINTDFNPVLYFRHLRHWLDQFAARGWALGGLLATVLAVYLWRQRPVPRVLFASGFAASALEIVLLAVYQALYGSVYRQVGLIVTTFMAGLAIGAWLVNRRLERLSRPGRALMWLALGLVGTAALLPFVLRQLGNLDAACATDAVGQGVVLAITFGLAALVGAQFPLAAATDRAPTVANAARLYTADLVGASFGALLVSALLIPLAGITAVCLLTAGLNLAAAALAWRPTVTS